MALPKAKTSTWYNERLTELQAEREAKEQRKKQFVETNFKKIEKLANDLRECSYKMENALVRMDYGSIVMELDEAHGIGEEGLELMDGLKEN